MRPVVGPLLLRREGKGELYWTLLQATSRRGGTAADVIGVSSVVAGRADKTVAVPSRRSGRKSRVAVARIAAVGVVLTQRDAGPVVWARLAIGLDLLPLDPAGVKARPQRTERIVLPVPAAVLVVGEQRALRLPLVYLVPLVYVLRRVAFDAPPLVLEHWLRQLPSILWQITELVGNGWNSPWVAVVNVVESVGTASAIGRVGVILKPSICAGVATGRQEVEVRACPVLWNSTQIDHPEGRVVPDVLCPRLVGGDDKVRVVRGHPFL